MRILHITKACGGGIKRHLELLAPALAHLGAEQYLLAASSEPENDFLQTTVPQFPGETDFYNLPSSLWHPWQFLRLLRIVRNTVKRWRPDIIHLHAFWGGLAGRLQNFRLSPSPAIVYSPHAFSWHPDAPRWQNLAVRLAERHLYRASQALVFVGEAEFAQAKELGLPEGKCHLVANALPPMFTRQLATRDEAQRHLQLDQEHRHLLFAGRPVWQKGLDCLAAALPLLPVETPWLCHFFWDDSQQAPLLRSLLASPAGRLCRVHPLQPNLSRYLRGFDAAVLPSRYEGCSYALLECLAAGLPLLVSPEASLGISMHSTATLLSWNRRQPAEFPAILDNVPPLAEPSAPNYTSDDQARRLMDVYQSLVGLV